MFLMRTTGMKILVKNRTWKFTIFFCLVTNLFALEITYASDFLGFGRLFRLFRSRRSTSSSARHDSGTSRTIVPTQDHAGNNDFRTGNPVRMREIMEIINRINGPNLRYSHSPPNSSTDRLADEEMTETIERLTRPGGDRVLNGEVLDEETAAIVAQDLREQLIANRNRYSIGPNYVRIVRRTGEATQPTSTEAPVIVRPVNRDELIQQLEGAIQLLGGLERMIGMVSSDGSTDSQSTQPAHEGFFGRMKSFKKCASILSAIIATSRIKNSATTGQRNEGQDQSKRNENYEVDCTICYNDMLPDEVLVSAECGHLFCEKCIRKWIGSSPEIRRGSQESEGLCPVCRTAVGNLRRVRLPKIECTKTQRATAMREAIRECKKLKKEEKTIESFKEERGYKKYKFHCSRCSYDFASEDDARTINHLKCGHMLCGECMKKDAVAMQKCPVCKTRVNTEDTREIRKPNISRDDE